MELISALATIALWGLAAVGLVAVAAVLTAAFAFARWLSRLERHG